MSFQCVAHRLRYLQRVTRNQAGEEVVEDDPEVGDVVELSPEVADRAAARERAVEPVGDDARPPA